MQEYSWKQNLKESAILMGMGISGALLVVALWYLIGMSFWALVVLIEGPPSLAVGG